MKSGANMAIIHNFAQKAQSQSNETINNAQSRLKKRGLINFVEAAYERLCEHNNQIQALKSPQLKNMYMYSFYTLDDVGNGLSPNKIDDKIDNIIMKTLQNINNYGEEFLQNNNMPTRLSDDLYAAAFAHHVMKDTENKDKEKEYIDVIGKNAYTIMTCADALQTKPKDFLSPDTPPESKVLHLVKLKMHSDAILSASEGLHNDTPEKQSKNINEIERYVNHLKRLNLTPEHSEIERITILRINEAKQNLDSFHAAPPAPDQLEI